MVVTGSHKFSTYGSNPLTDISSLSCSEQDQRWEVAQSALRPPNTKRTICEGRNRDRRNGATKTIRNSTQIGWLNMLKWANEWLLRNSANWHCNLGRRCANVETCWQQQMEGRTVYQKHRTMQNFNNDVYGLTPVRWRKAHVKGLL